MKKIQKKYLQMERGNQKKIHKNRRQNNTINNKLITKDFVNCYQRQQKSHGNCYQFWKRDLRGILVSISFAQDSTKTTFP